MKKTSSEISQFEREGFGLVYERYAMGRMLERMVADCHIRSVLELPGGGIKAMPSIYSLSMGLAGCHVTLVNGEETSLDVWKKFDIEDRISFIECEDLGNTNLPDQSFDLVWNFVVFGTLDNPESVLKEMKRISKKYVCLFLSNKRNIGYYFHRFAHWYAKIPWTHGDVSLRLPKNIKHMMNNVGLNVEKVDLVDTPPWPDSIGFRDIRLHRLMLEHGVDLAKVDWTSDYVDYLKLNRFPLWIKLVHAFESIPTPYFLKQFYAHLFYVLASVTI
jgi:SAM-dependent methyltransferase